MKKLTKIKEKIKSKTRTKPPLKYWLLTPVAIIDIAIDKTIGWREKTK